MLCSLKNKHFSSYNYKKLRMPFTGEQLSISFVCPSIISCTVNTPIFGSDSFVISILSIARHSSAIRSRDKNDVIYGRPVFGHDKSLFVNEIVFVSFSLLGVGIINTPFCQDLILMMKRVSLKDLLASSSNLIVCLSSSSFCLLS